MKVWLIRDLEPIPGDPGERRLMRAGMLAQALARRGHETVWFTSSFDHYQKRQRADADRVTVPEAGLTIRVLSGPGYRRNMSLARIAHNRSFARRWLELAVAATDRPDVLITDIPTTEAADAVVGYGQRQGIPVVLSIRDLWPDFFVDYLPPPFRPLARPFIFPLDMQARRAAAGATSLIGISDAYLAWGRAKGARGANSADRVFPLGYDARPLPNATTRAALRTNLDAGDRHIVSFVGSWGHTYDLELVLETARRLASRRDILFVIAGDRDTQPALRDAFVKLPNVRLTGWLDAGEIAALVSISALGLLPYRPNAPQGLPNKVFEYMAYGAFGLATLDGEIADFYATTQAGRAVGRDLAGAIPGALTEALDPAARTARITTFAASYDAATVYGAMVDHIESIARADRQARYGTCLVRAARDN